MSSIKKYAKALIKSKPSNEILTTNEKNASLSAEKDNDREDCFDKTVKTVCQSKNVTTSSLTNTSMTKKKNLVKGEGKTKNSVQTNSNFFCQNVDIKSSLELSMDDGDEHFRPNHHQIKSHIFEQLEPDIKNSKNVLKTPTNVKNVKQATKTKHESGTKKNIVKLTKIPDLVTETIELSSEESNSVITDSSSKKDNQTDFFKVMMESRKKSIGMNSPGKEKMRDENPLELSAQKEIKVKRSLALSKWADQKGASKRREMEEVHGEHIKRVLKKRARSFKNMLLHNGINGSPKSELENDSQHRNVDGVNGTCESDDNNEPNNYRNKKRIRNSKCEIENSTLKKTKLQSPKGNVCLPAVLEPFSNDDWSIFKQKSMKDEFLSGLSPPLRKTESVLSYFDKKESNDDDELVEVLVYENMCEDEFKLDDSDIIQVLIPKPTVSKKGKLKEKIKVKSGKNKKSDDLSEISSTELHKGDVTIEDFKLVNVNSQQIVESSPGGNGSGRPKRNIRKPVKYIQDSSNESDTNSEDFEIFSTNKKRDKNINRKSIKTINTEKSLSNKPNKENKNFENIVSPIMIVNLQSPEIIKSCKSLKTISVPKREEKLAPLFRKSLPKPLVDQSVIEARKLFLQSGVPDSIKIQLDKAPIVSSVDIFPVTNHVQQIPNESDDDYGIWNLPPSSHISDALNDTDNLINNDAKCLLKDFINLESDSENNNIDTWIKIFHESKMVNYKEGLKKIKEIYPHFPVNRTFRQLWEKFSSDSNLDKSSDLDPKIKNISSLSSSLWTEKYKPATSSEVLGNFKSVNSLKKWLESWKEYNELSTTTIFKRSRINSDSSSDFYASDSGSKDSMRIPNNLMVITGASGCGKTSSVYAVSNELGINVLEVNASSRRTGKRVLSELQEATQSHKVLTKTNSDSSVNGFLNFSNNCTTENSLKENTSNKNDKIAKKVGLLRMNSENVKSRSSPKLTNNDSSSQKSADIMSLMLIDDADIVFEEDDGFVGGLVQLVQSSKRPVVILASDQNCSHLQRFIIEANVIHFNPHHGQILGPWLDVLVLIECNKVIPNLCASLLEINKGDIRSTILQLQYWILGSKPRTKKTDINLTLPLDSLDNSEISQSSVSFNGWPDDDSNSSNKSNCKLTKNKYHVNKTFCDNNLRMFLSQYIFHTCNLRDISLSTSDWFHSNNENNFNDVQLANEKSVKENNIKIFILGNIGDLCDNLSSVDLMQSYSKTLTGKVKLPWLTEPKDSLSESENFSMFKNHQYISNAWCQYMIQNSTKLVRRILNSNDTPNVTVLDSFDTRCGQKEAVTHFQFSEAITCGAQLDRRSVSLDYMATFRTICRTEKERSKNNFKRNNRFYHYLNSLSIDGKDKVYDDVCNTLSLDSS